MLQEFFRFVWKRKLWWMAPLFLIMLVLSALIIFTQNSILAPFIYTLF
ncbi:MAG TPA: DUF5989 family protein [Candidatus Gracilibacteria bacterium]|nr:DUF5989 family protein [Candidatus Gracilibacteria bacterium]